MENIDLSEFFRTKAESIDFLARLNKFSDSLYKTDFNLESSLSQCLGLSKKDKFLILLRENNINTSTPADIKIYLEKLQETINNLPVLSLALSFEPNEDTLKILNEWFSVNIKKQYIFDITINPSLLAGIEINFKGKFMDFSAKEKFNKILKEILDSQPTKVISKPTTDNKNI